VTRKVHPLGRHGRPGADAAVRLAWDIAISTFGSRQALYEYYFFGDPVRMAGALISGYGREPYMTHVREFLARDSFSLD